MSTNTQVIESFLNNENSTARNLSSDNGSLFSYRLEIARWVGNKIIIFDYTATGGFFQSMTTSSHVGMMKGHLNTNNVMPVEFATKIGLIRN